MREDDDKGDQVAFGDGRERSGGLLEGIAGVAKRVAVCAFVDEFLFDEATVAQPFEVLVEAAVVDGVGIALVGVRFECEAVRFVVDIVTDELRLTEWAVFRTVAECSVASLAEVSR